jgi:hypothetical protein
MSCRIAVDAGDVHNPNALSADPDEDSGESLERIDLSQPIEATMSPRVTVARESSIPHPHGNAPTAGDTPTDTERPPPLNLEQLHTERVRTSVRRVSVHKRHLDDAPDSLRLESTWRRVTRTVFNDPTRATVVYSPRALATMRGQSRRDAWPKCGVM